MCLQWGSGTGLVGRPSDNENKVHNGRMDNLRTPLPTISDICEAGSLANKQHGRNFVPTLLLTRATGASYLAAIIQSSSVSAGKKNSLWIHAWVWLRFYLILSPLCIPIDNQ